MKIGEYLDPGERLKFCPCEHERPFDESKHLQPPVGGRKLRGPKRIEHRPLARATLPGRNAAGPAGVGAYEHARWLLVGSRWLAGLVNWIVVAH
jgi:hypothetical protein